MRVLIVKEYNGPWQAIAEHRIVACKEVMINGKAICIVKVVEPSITGTESVVEMHLEAKLNELFENAEIVKAHSEEYKNDHHQG